MNELTFYNEQYIQVRSTDALPFKYSHHMFYAFLDPSTRPYYVSSVCSVFSAVLPEKIISSKWVASSSVFDYFWLL
jgi:hypothetical protein